MANATQLRQSCLPSDPVEPGFHKHLCACGTAWKHSKEELRDQCDSEEEWETAHSCPACGKSQYEIHYTPEEEAAAEAEFKERTKHMHPFELLLRAMMGGPL